MAVHDERWRRRDGETMKKARTKKPEALPPNELAPDTRSGENIPGDERRESAKPGRRGLLKAVFAHSGAVLGKTAETVRPALEKLARVDRLLSPSYLVPPKPMILVAIMAMVSALVMTIESVHFNMLLLVSNYVTATSVISIAMLGIAIGGFLAFTLSKLRSWIIIAMASALLFVSLLLSYLTILDFAAIGFPYYMILPYVSASLIISIILMETKSTIAYFSNLAASGLGAIAPIWLLPALKSEGALLASMLVPIAILFLLSLRIRNAVLKGLAAAALLVAGIMFCGFISRSTAFPEKIPAQVFEGKIVPEMIAAPDEKRGVNFTVEFLKRAYALDEKTGVYRFASDEYDWKRAKHFLGVLGFSDRFGLKWLSWFERRPYLEDPKAIPAPVFENDILRAARTRYAYNFRRDFDLDFLRSAYALQGKDYVLSGEKYARARAKLLLCDLGHFPYIDLALDLRRNGSYDDGHKGFIRNDRIVLDEDSTLGRVQMTWLGNSYNMAINGVMLDNMDSEPWMFYDPRVPYLKDAKVFIVGLSADGVIKSAKTHPGAKVAGAELNPIIWRAMTDGGIFQTFTADPFKDVDAVLAEARSRLENSKEKYDLITLMNIHQDHGPIATLGPENMHTVEAVKMMLGRLTERGMLDYEEIMGGRRSELFLLKMMNTLKTALRESGQADPGLCIHITKWDFSAGKDSFRTISVKNNPFTKKEVAALEDYMAKIKALGGFYGVGTVYNPLVPQNTFFDAFIRGEDRKSLHELPPKAVADEFAAKVLSRAPDPRDADFALRWYKHGGDGYYYLRDADMTPANRYRLENIMDRAGYSLDIDLSPVFDDSPFPFNVYTKKTEITDILAKLLPIALLLAIPLLVILFRSAGAYRVSLIPPVAFAAIAGFGYMLVEIVLMQKFQLFIGDPTLSLIIVLAGMLFFSGAGSFASGSLPRWLILGMVAAIPLLLGLYGWKIDAWFEALRFLQGGSRLVMAALIILPLSFLMGIPFPNALELIKTKTSPDFASLLFGVNGLASTLGSAMAFLFNASRGYQFSFTAGTLCYLAATAFFVYFSLRAGGRKAAA
jgi:hypothetical protein